MSSRDALRAIITRHCAWLEVQVEEIDAALSAEAGDGHGDETVEKLHELVHQITGASGTVGFHEVSSVSADLEKHLKSLRDREVTAFSGSERLKAVELFDRLRRVIAGVSPDRSTLYNTDIKKVGGPRWDMTI